jgi:hypothetical protein
VKCVFGHRHPPVRVVGVVPEAAFSRSALARVYHCAECAALAAAPAELDRQEYESPQAARRAGQSAPCPVCLPPFVSEARARGEWLVICSCGWRFIVSPLQRARAMGYVHETRMRQEPDVQAGEVTARRHSCRVMRAPQSD